MEEGSRPEVSVPASAAGTGRSFAPPEAPALRDAEAILVRAAADEAAADAARDLLRSEPQVPLPPDERIAVILRAGEQVFAVRHSAFVERRLESPAEHMNGIAGDLYLTSERLLLLGRLRLAFELAHIDDVVIAGERLLLVFRDGRGVSLDASEPRLLRVQIAAARARMSG